MKDNALVYSQCALAYVLVDVDYLEDQSREFGKLQVGQIFTPLKSVCPTDSDKFLLTIWQSISVVLNDNIDMLSEGKLVSSPFLLLR